MLASAAVLVLFALAYPRTVPHPLAKCIVEALADAGLKIVSADPKMTDP